MPDPETVTYDGFGAPIVDGGYDLDGTLADAVWCDDGGTE